MSRPWFKFYTRDFRDGVRVLTLEEIGAYTLVLSLIYETGGRITNDERAICAQIGCDIRVWRRVSQKLVSEGKIIATDDGFLTNDRAQKEITSAELIGEKRRTSGRIGGELSGKSRAKSLKNNESDEASASILLHTEYRRQKAEAHSDKSECGETTNFEQPDLLVEQAFEKPKPDGKRGARIADDWAPSPADMAFASSLGLVNGSLQRTADEFRDYWLAAAGAKGVKLDWSATWRNWVRRQTSGSFAPKPKPAYRNGIRPNRYIQPVKCQTRTEV